MGTRLTNVALLLALGATVLALLLYDYLPKRRWQLLSEYTVFFAPYADELEGGPSHSEWANEAERIWRCRVERQGQFVYCGINILLAQSSNVPFVPF